MKTPPGYPKDQVSLCMIVKDEAERLGRCLASAAPWVGAMVVVDTGSSDDTVAIAEAHGATVLHFPWIDDFAAARNVGLDAATTRWALVLDADEELDVHDPALLADALRTTTYGGYTLPLANQTDDGRATAARVFRLFDRTLPGMRYRGAMHEQVAAVAELKVTNAVLPAVTIRHDGYLARNIVAKGKLERNARLARKNLAERPDDPHAWYVLGLSLQNDHAAERQEAFEQAIARFQAAGAGKGEAYVGHAHMCLARDASRAGDLAAALAYAERGLASFPHLPELRMVRGKQRLRDLDHRGAIADFRACLAPEAQRFTLSELPPAEVVRLAREGLSLGVRLALADGDLEAALAELAAAPAEDPAELEGLKAAFASLLAADRFDDVESLLARLPAVVGAGRWRALRQRFAEALVDGGFTDVALHLLLEARAEAPGDPDLYYWIGRCALERAQPDDARVMWQTCLELAPDHDLARRSLAVLP